MSKIIKTAAAVAMLLSGATYVAAQSQIQMLTRARCRRMARTLSLMTTRRRPIRRRVPVWARARLVLRQRAGLSNSKPETPADKNTTDLKKLDKQGRGGQAN